MVIFAVIATLTGGCIRPKVAVPGKAVETASPNWVQLQPGWRVRVVIPILKSGGYLVKTKPAKTGEVINPQRAGITPSKNTPPNLTLSASPDFIGYEVSWYTVKLRRGGGVHVVFTSAEIHKQGQITLSHHTIRPMFQLPKRARWVRILHLLRASPADHNSAILAANRLAALDELTQQVQSNPSTCKVHQHVFCAWIPLGIAVIPESRSGDEGSGKWVPAF